MTKSTFKLIEFKAPPVKRGNISEETLAMEAALKQNPGKWALVASQTYPTKPRRYLDNKAEWEVKRVYNYGTNKVCDVYLRYIGKSRYGKS